MPRYGPFIHQVYIADGFADDCDELVHRCLGEENLDYQAFCRIWKELNMGCVYEGRTLGAEIAELSEELIHVGKHYMLKDTSNFEESVVGLFVVYALLNLQPYKGFACLRIVPEDLPAISRMEHVARRERRYEVLYILGSLLIKGPVEYHAAKREYGMDIAVRKYLEGFTSIDKLGVRPKGVFRRQNEELDILKELDVLTKQYEQAKRAVTGTFKLESSLNYIDANMATDLQCKMLKIISGIHEDQYGSIEAEGDKLSQSRRAIKERAMREDVKPVRHLEDINKKKSKLTINKGKNEGKEPPKKNTKSNIKKEKSPISKLKRKRRIPVSPRTLKKSRSQTDFDIDEDTTSEDDESDDNDCPSNEKDIGVECMPLLERIKAVKLEKKRKNLKETITEVEKADDNTMTTEADNEQELDIEIETLPVLIRTEDQGKLFEIEIIDKKKEEKSEVTKPRVKTYKRKESALKKISSIPGVSIKKITDTEVTEPEPSTSSANDLARIIGIDDENKEKEKDVGLTETDMEQGLGMQCAKVDKRDCKRVHIQSKLKRLGMLPIANFNPPEVLICNAPDEDDGNEEGSQESTGLNAIED